MRPQTKKALDLIQRKISQKGPSGEIMLLAYDREACAAFGENYDRNCTPRRLNVESINGYAAA